MKEVIMMRNKRQYVRPLTADQPQAKPVRLSEFDGQRMAVLMRRGHERVVLRGTATFVRDDSVGSTLMIRLDKDEPGHPVFVISEKEWDGRIVPDFHHGCDFCVVVG